MQCTMNRSGALLAVLALAVALLASAAATAEEFSSQYTSADVKKCRKFDRLVVAGDEIAASWACPGVAGYLVVVSEDDLRTTVSVGKTTKAAGNEPVASERFGPFNFSYETVEWRSVKGAKTPFAIIQRWNISDNANPTKEGRPGRAPLLIVTRLPPGPVCRVAFVDAGANKEPNVLARRAADELARDFRCGKDEVRIIGERGRAIELAKD